VGEQVVRLNTQYNQAVTGVLMGVLEQADLVDLILLVAVQLVRALQGTQTLHTHRAVPVLVTVQFLNGVKNGNL
jgi:hypothetical protein